MVAFYYKRRIPIGGSPYSQRRPFRALALRVDPFPSWGAAPGRCPPPLRGRGARFWGGACFWGCAAFRGGVGWRRGLGLGFGV